MTENFTLYFEISPKLSSQKSDTPREIRRDIIQSQEQVLRSISRIGSNLTFSLRYYFNPNQAPKIRTYLLLSQTHEHQAEDTSEQVSRLLTKGNLSNFFNLSPTANYNQLQSLNWVESVGEVLKQEELIETQNYYLPYLFEPNQANDMLAVYNVISRLDNKLILEITLQTYQNSADKPLWVNAINQMIEQLGKVNSASSNRNNLLPTTLSIYQKYQQLYSNSELFKYSIKALAENRGDASVVLHTLLEHATKENSYGKQGQVVIVDRSNPKFSESLKATENVEISTAIEWQGWERDFGQLLIRDAIKPKKSGLARFSDGSGSITNRFSSPAPQNLTPSEPSSFSRLALSGSSALAKFSSPPPAKIADLKPLHRLATAQEISGFFRIAIPNLSSNIGLDEAMNQLPEVLKIEDVIKNYGEHITEDTYIVGVDEEGQPCVSDFEAIAHRLVAGVPGSGKTNFISSVIYQFLYASSKLNIEREIYIADFKEGLDFYRITRQHNSIKLITEFEDLASLLSRLVGKYKQRIHLIKEHDVDNLKQLREKGKTRSVER